MGQYVFFWQLVLLRRFHLFVIFFTFSISLICLSLFLLWCIRWDLHTYGLLSNLNVQNVFVSLFIDFEAFILYIFWILYIDYEECCIVFTFVVDIICNSIAYSGFSCTILMSCLILSTVVEIYQWSMFIINIFSFIQSHYL